MSNMSWLESRLLRLLLIEDNPHDARMAVRLLNAGNLANKAMIDISNTFEGGKRALHEKAYDLVLLDLNLPDAPASGIDNLKIFLTEFPDIPVIVFTGTLSDLGLQAIRTGAQDYLDKSTLEPEGLAKSVEYSIERFRLRQSLKHYRSERDRYQQMVRSVTNFFYRDVYNPLHLALQQDNDRETMRAEVSKVWEQANVLVDMCSIQQDQSVEDLMTFSIRDVMDDTRVSIARVFPKGGISINFETEQGLPDLVKGNPRNLRQILFNLIHLAGKRSNPVAVDIRVERQMLDANRDTLVFTVSDDGPGLSPQDAARVFMPFSQVFNRPPLSLLGLHLFTVKRLVEMNQGQVWLESQRDKGTTLGFNMVVEKPDSTKSEIHTPPRNEYFVERKIQPRVLIADDLLLNQFTLSTWVRNLWLPFSVAPDGESAITLYRDQPFDLILIDADRNDQEGVRVCREIKHLAHRPGDVVVVGITDPNEEVNTNQYIGAGIDDFLYKPVSPRQLFKLLKKHFDR